MMRVREAVKSIDAHTPSPRSGEGLGGEVRLLESDPDAERKVAAAALFPHSDARWEDLRADPGQVLEAILGDRANRRQRAPRALEHAQYAFEIVANFAAYRDLHRHRMLTQDRQLLGTALGYDTPPGLSEFGMEARCRSAIEAAAAVHAGLARDA